MAMARVKNDLSEGSSSGWEKFCEMQARTAALDFAEAFRRFVTDHAAGGHSCAPFSHKDFLKRFVDNFQETFEHEIRKCNHLNGYAAAAAAAAAAASGCSGGSEPLCESPPEAGDAAPAPAAVTAKSTGRSLLQRLGSFKNTLRRGRGVFLKQRSDEVELSPSRARPHDDRLRGRLSKILVEIKYQGAVNYLTGDNLEAWSRCRLALVRTAAGHLLEFFTPPKVRAGRGLGTGKRVWKVNERWACTRGQAGLKIRGPDLQL